MLKVKMGEDITVGLTACGDRVVKTVTQSRRKGYFM